MKIDPYKHEEKYLKWKSKTQHGIPGISRANSDIVLQYMSDMENGINISCKSVKGPRSFIRLNNLKQRMIFLAKKIENHCNVDLADLDEKQIIMFFNAMRNGTIKRLDGKSYQSVVDFVKPFKAFWHWHMKVSKKNGIAIPDITEDLDVSNPKPRWVYLSESQVQALCDNAKPKYKTLIWFLYDTGIRSPGELINVRVSDLHDQCKELTVREATAKKGSFGRRIKLMLCPELVRQHVLDNDLHPEDVLFDISYRSVNQYLKRLARRVLGDGVSLAGEKYSNLTMYDFRHCACCYWLPRYKSESALKYRFGWKKSDKIHYYSELLGMKDTISEQDMLIDVNKTELERRVQKAERENQIFREQQEAQRADITRLQSLTRILMLKLTQLESLPLPSMTCSQQGGSSKSPAVRQHVEESPHLNAFSVSP